MQAALVLEDGKVFSGTASADFQERIAEVVFNTAVVGYQEMVTDPANANKILVLTYPLIGNYGVAPKFNESKKAWASGLVIKEQSRIYSNWQAKQSFADFLQKEKLPCLFGVDTRGLAVHLRQKGQMLGIISTSKQAPKGLVEKISIFRQKNKASLLPEISVKKITTLSRGKIKLGVLDLGIPQSLLKQLQSLGLGITLLPYSLKAEEILHLKLSGLLISSGPEEDAGLKEVINNTKKLVGKLPILGVACGHEVLASALGAKLCKMKLGHRGVNYPLQRPASYKGEITAQNHGWAVELESLSKIKDIKITGYNLNDRTVEEMESKKLKLIGVQYQLNCPGFQEVNPVLARFKKMLK